MNWSSWKTWALVGAAVVALFAIFTFAFPESALQEKAQPAPPAYDEAEGSARPQTRKTGPRPIETGVETIHMDWLEPDTGSFRSTRNIFSFGEPPPPPAPKPPPPPPDKDKDGIPDFQDNCPDVSNADQIDVDRNGVGDKCQTGEIIPPPPPKPTPPQFPYTFLGTFGPKDRPIAVFSAGDEISNVRVGQTFGGRFILRSIGIESVDIGFVGFPPDERRRIAVGGK